MGGKVLGEEGGQTVVDITYERRVKKEAGQDGLYSCFLGL